MARIIDPLKPLAVPIDSVRPDPRNARKHPPRNIEVLKNSLKAYGQRKPIVVNKAEDNRIIAGNGLWQAAKELGWEYIAAVFVGDDPATATGYALMDNQSALLAQWNFEQLEELINELKEEDFALELTGFDVEDLDFIEPEEVGEDEEFVTQAVDKAEELREKWGVERGQIWEIPSATVPGRVHRVMCGNSYAPEDTSRLGGQFDLVLTDPPYGISVVGAGGSIGKGVLAKEGIYSPVWGDDREFDPSPFVALAPRIILFGANYYPRSLPHRGQWLVWDKGFPEGVTFSQCELIWTNGDGTAVKKYEVTWRGMIREGESGSRWHPTQKPVKLIKMLLRDFSEEGAVVYDPFLGSGTTAIACEQLGRICYGMEIEPKYVAVTLERLAQLGLELRLVED